MPSAWPTALCSATSRAGKMSGWPAADKQIDLGGPGPDAGNGRHLADRGLGVEIAEAGEVEAVQHGLGHREHGALLRPRQAGLAKQPVAGGKQRFRRQRIGELDEPAEDRVGAGAGNLLRDDDRDEAR